MSTEAQLERAGGTAVAEEVTPFGGLEFTGELSRDAVRLASLAEGTASPSSDDVRFIAKASCGGGERKGGTALSISKNTWVSHNPPAFVLVTVYRYSYYILYYTTLPSFSVLM